MFSDGCQWSVQRCDCTDASFKSNLNSNMIFHMDSRKMKNISWGFLRVNSPICCADEFCFSQNLRSLITVLVLLDWFNALWCLFNSLGSSNNRAGARMCSKWVPRNNWTVLSDSMEFTLYCMRTVSSWKSPRHCTDIISNSHDWKFKSSGFLLWYEVLNW